MHVIVKNHNAKRNIANVLMQVLLALKHVIAVIAAIKFKTNKMGLKKKIMKINNLKMLTILTVIINDELNKRYYEIKNKIYIKCIKLYDFILLT